MNVIIDLDNTLFYNDIVDKACADAGIERTSRHDLTDLPIDVQHRCWSDFESVDIMCNLKPFDTAIGIDTFLKERGCKVYIVTARSLNLEEGTVAMVNKYFP